MPSRHRYTSRPTRRRLYLTALSVAAGALFAARSAAAAERLTTFKMLDQPQL